MIIDIQNKIRRLKEETDTLILAHAYQAREILEVADYVGDSFGLSEQAAKAPHKNVIMCGVRFMAETCKILCPDKHVYLANPTAGCPMAEQLDPSGLAALKEKYKGYTVVAYVNTTAALKTMCDVCVTSSSALEIVKKIENDNILFIPDTNLGTYVKESLPEKNIVLYNGCCPTHAKITKAQAEATKAAHPDALMLVHPECRPEVVAMADYVGSTTGIMAYAKKSDAKEFIIGTETSIAEHLQYECEGKKFYPLSLELMCNNMKITTLPDLYNCLAGEGGEEIILDADTIKAARGCIDEMLRLG